MTIRDLCPELHQKAINELFEKPERIQDDLSAIKEWLKKQPHITARMDDQWLLSFLRGCKHSLERTKEKIDLFYTMKTAVPEITQCLSPKDPDIQHLLNSGVILPLLKSDKPDDPRIIIVRPGSFDATKIMITKMMCFGQMFINLQMKDDDQSMIAGQIYIIDLKSVGLSLFSQVTPSLMKKMVLSRQDALPIRDKGTHHVNTPAAAEAIFNISRKFMNEKSKSRFFVHSGGMDSLNISFSKTILPTEYGGDAGPVQDLIDYWKKKFEENEQFFVDDIQYKTDESKRVGAPKTPESLFGIEGSFRQLNFD